MNMLESRSVIPAFAGAFRVRGPSPGNWRWTLRKHNGLNVGAMNVAAAEVYAETKRFINVRS